MTTKPAKPVMTTRQYEVSPTVADYAAMYHALGQPKDPTAETCRNYYCTAAGSPKAQRFEALGWWTLSCIINDGRATIYCVNEAGKQALVECMNGDMPVPSDCDTPESLWPGFSAPHPTRH
jgi:hypothetical protein